MELSFPPTLVVTGHPCPLLLAEDKSHGRNSGGSRGLGHAQCQGWHLAILVFPYKRGEGEGEREWQERERERREGDANQGVYG